MDTLPLFIKCRKRYADLVDALEHIASHHKDNPIEGYEESLMEIDQSITDLRSLLLQHPLHAVAQEVYFFKDIKPLFVSQFIFFAKILEIEVAKPNAGQHILKDYYEHELTQLKNFVDACNGFYEYYRRNATYHDAHYFVRNQFDFKRTIDCHLYNYDRSFTTSYDHQVAQIIAHDRLEQYLLQSIYALDTYFFEKFSEKSPMHWSSSKSALIELLYGLQVMGCLNSGKGDFSALVKFAEKSFNIDLGNFYKTLHEIKSRKIDRTKFLTLLQHHLDKHFEELDGV